MEPHRKDVSGNGKESGSRGQQIGPPQQMLSRKQGQGHRYEALERIENQGQGAKFGGAAGHVGGPDIAASALANVLAAEGSHQKEAERDGSGEVTESGGEQVGSQGLSRSFGRCRRIERETVQAGIARPAPRELALIQKELAGGHGTKLGGGHRSQFLLQALEDTVGPVAVAPAGSARGAALARQGQVGAEGVGLAGQVEGGGEVIDGRGERRQFRARLNSNPEHPGGPGSGEEAVAAKADLETRHTQGSQGAFQEWNRRLRALADEFQGDVQGFLAHPARRRREVAHPLQKARDTQADGVVEIEGQEEAHRTSSVASLQSRARPWRCRSGSRGSCFGPAAWVPFPGSLASGD